MIIRVISSILMGRVVWRCLAGLSIVNFKHETGGMKPIVYLIGAGPGDPGLITLRGAHALRASDVVLYDGLSNAAILQHAPAAEHVCVGKHGQTRIWTQDEIIAEMLRLAAQGKVVARLKGGDPAVFARTAEEIDALREAGIPFEIVPGITAALAAGSFAGIPVTHRELASAVALVTGHEQPGKTESALDWDALANFPGTLVVYMGVTTAKQWTQALIDGGKDPATPAALVRRCSHPDQETIQCRLDQIANRLTPASRFRPPVIAIIGPVATLAETMTWIGHRPLHGTSVLHGKSILVTRPIDQCQSLVEAIRQLGANPLVAPAIEIRPLDDFRELDEAIREIAAFDFLIFCSTNGVESFFDRLTHLGHDARALAGLRVAVVGRKTKAALMDHGIRADVLPQDFRAASLASLLETQVAGKKVAIIRASRGSDELPKRLAQAGADVHELVAYQNIDASEVDPIIDRQMRQGQIDWVTITSSATAANVVRLYGEALKKCRIAAISPVTAETLRQLDQTVDVVADPYTTEALLDAIVNQT